MKMNGRETKLVRISRHIFLVQNMTDQSQLENVEYLNYFGSIITNNGRFTRKIKARIAMVKVAFTSKLVLNLRKRLVDCYVRSTALHSAATWTL